MSEIITSQYDGHELSFNEQGWFNATQAANRFNKTVHEWVRLPDTQRYLDALSRKYGKIPYLKTKRGNHGGTWLHPKLAVRFAQWLDIDFALWCDEQIDLLLRKTHPTFNRRRLRHQTVASYKALSTALKMTREQQGKDTNTHHYMNEARLINWVITGDFTGLDRDSLSDDDLDLLAELEIQDLVLIGVGFTYKQRKTALGVIADNFREKRCVLPTSNPALSLEVESCY